MAKRGTAAFRASRHMAAIKSWRTRRANSGVKAGVKATPKARRSLKTKGYVKAKGIVSTLKARGAIKATSRGVTKNALTWGRSRSLRSKKEVPPLKRAALRAGWRGKSVSRSLKAGLLGGAKKRTDPLKGIGRATSGPRAPAKGERAALTRYKKSGSRSLKVKQPSISYKKPKADHRMNAGFKSYSKARSWAEKRSKETKRDFAIMKNAFGELSVFPAHDTSDYAKYEIVQTGPWKARKR
jgi:hypothetical protein